MYDYESENDWGCWVRIMNCTVKYLLCLKCKRKIDSTTAKIVQCKNPNCEEEVKTKWKKKLCCCDQDAYNCPLQFSRAMSWKLFQCDGRCFGQKNLAGHGWSKEWAAIRNSQVNEGRQPGCTEDTDCATFLQLYNQETKIVISKERKFSLVSRVEKLGITQADS